MLLFPCNRAEFDTPRLGFVITQQNVNEVSKTRMFVNDNLYDEFDLKKHNTFVETPIVEKNFKIRFHFLNQHDINNKFSISTLTWAPIKGLRRSPLWFFKDNNHAEIDRLLNRYSSSPSEQIELNFENFLSPDDRKTRINQIILNGKKQNIALPYVHLVQDYNQGIGICSALRTSWNTNPFYYLKMKSKIVKNIDDIQHINHFVKVNNITNLDQYFEFVRASYNLSMMSYITIGIHDKFNKDKYTLTRWTDNENIRNI